MNPEVSFASILLDIPVIWVSCMRPVFNPNPTIDVNESLFPLLWTLLDGSLPDDVLAPPVLIQPRNERNLAARRQPSFLDLPADLVRRSFRYQRLRAIRVLPA